MGRKSEKWLQARVRTPRWVRIPGERKFRWNDQGNAEFLWCQRCETWLEGAWSDILDALPVAARGLAMIASYIPVYGTALSFAINTSVSLAEGEWRRTDGHV